MTRGFTGELEMRILASGRRILLTSSTWCEHFDEPDTCTFTAPAGMHYDGPSIPPIFRTLYSPVIELAAAHHDALYALHCDDNGADVARATADRVMRDCAQVSQRRARKHMTPVRATYAAAIHWTQRWLIWAGLRVGGWFAWNRSHGRKMFQPDTIKP